MKDSTRALISSICVLISIGGLFYILVTPTLFYGEGAWLSILISAIVKLVSSIAILLCIFIFGISIIKK